MIAHKNANSGIKRHGQGFGRGDGFVINHNQVGAGRHRRWRVAGSHQGLWNGETAPQFDLLTVTGKPQFGINRQLQFREVDQLEILAAQLELILIRLPVGQLYFAGALDPTGTGPEGERVEKNPIRSQPSLESHIGQLNAGGRQIGRSSRQTKNTPQFRVSPTAAKGPVKIKQAAGFPNGTGEQDGQQPSFPKMAGQFTLDRPFRRENQRPTERKWQLNLALQSPMIFERHHHMTGQTITAPAPPSRSLSQLSGQ